MVKIGSRNSKFPLHLYFRCLTSLPVPAIYHSEYIHRLDYQTIDSRQYRRFPSSGMNSGFFSNHRSGHERRSGPDERDVTSFVSSQKDWGGDRDQRPDILFDLYKPVQQNLPEPGYLFTPSPTQAFPELCVVIDDYERQPLLNYPELPIIISTRVEGWLLEAWMRSNLEISIEDLLQRMPYLPKDKREKAHGQGGFCNTLSGRRRDFRKTGRCLSWAGNSANASLFDRRIINEVEANPEWHRDNTTRYLEDLTKAHRERLEKENTAASAKRRAEKAERRRNGSGPSPGNASSPFGGNPTTPETAPSLQDEEEQHSTGRAQKRPRTDKGYVSTDPVHFTHFGPRLDNTGHHFDPFLASLNQRNRGFEASGVHSGSQHASDAPAFPGIRDDYQHASEMPSLPAAQNGFENLSEGPPIPTHMSPVFPPAQDGTELDPAGWLPGWTPLDDAGPSASTNIPPAPSSEPLKSGLDLIQWFADRSVYYMRRDHVQRPQHITDDQRFSSTINSQDREQLFFALYPAIFSAVHTRQNHRFTIDLDTYYRNTYNDLQDQLIHAAYLANPAADLYAEEQRLQPRDAWSGSIASFDDAYSVDIWWDHEAREKIKTDSCPYTLGPEFERKAGAQGRLSAEKGC